MSVLVLAHDGPERGLLRAALSGLTSADYSFATSWDEFMQSLVANRPSAVILAHSTLAQNGEAGVKAADMTLRALNVATVIALSHADKEARFPLELETEFEHFLVEPYGPKGLARAVASAQGLTSDAWPVASGTDAPDTDAPDAGAPDAGAATPRPLATPTVTASSDPAAAAEDDAFDSAAMPLAAAGTVTPVAASPVAMAPSAETPFAVSSVSPTAAVIRPSAETPFVTPSAETPFAVAQVGPTPSAETPFSIAPVATSSVETPVASERPRAAAPTSAQASQLVETRQADEFLNVPLTPDAIRAPNAASFFGSEFADADLDRATSQDTTQVEAVPPAEFDVSGVSAALDDLFTTPSSGGASPADAAVHSGSTASSATALPAPEVAVNEASLTSPSEEASPSAHASTPAAQKSGANETVRMSGSRPISVERSISDTGSSLAHSGSASGSGPRLSLSLPDPNAGDLSTVHLPRVLYALAIARATGELRVRTASLHRRIVLLQGEPGTVFQVPTADDERKLLSTFQWSAGEYHFDAKDVPEAQFYTFGEPLELISRGIHRHFGLNETATALGAYLKKYPVVTDQMSRFKRVLGLEGFGDVAMSLDGTRTLEERMMTAGMETEAVLRHIFFAWLTGVAIFMDEPCEGPVQVTFEIPSVHDANSSKLERSRSTSSTRSGIRTGSYNSPTIVETAARTAPASKETEDQTAVFDELRARWDVLSTGTRHEVFSLSPGCGPEEVNRRFYELVRQYHPDKYARSHNSQIRSLAEKIFVHIRKVHGELMSIERGEEPQPQSAARRTTPSDGNPSAQSGAQRRRARAANTMAASGSSRTTRSRASGRKVSDVMERLRSRNESGESRVVSGVHKTISPIGGSGVHNTVGPAVGSGIHKTISTGGARTSVRRLSPEQLHRNARSACEQGNYAKALDLLELSRTRGASGPLSDAYHHFLRYTQKLLSPAEAIDLIDAISEEFAEEQREEYSMALTLAGHACRLEELSDDAYKYYRRAVRAWSANESASRWLRHMKKRIESDDKKGPFSSAFLNKLFTSGKNK